MYTARRRARWVEYCIMEIRPATRADLAQLRDIDGTIESTQYVFLDRTGEGLVTSWRLQARPLREKLIEPNPLDDERDFALRQIVNSADEGIALLGEHDDQVIAAALALPDPTHRTMRILDLRVDYDHRRQGLATVMVYQIIEQARSRELRAVVAETRTNNFPVNQLFQKLAFELSGLDTSRFSNHDLVKEAATLFWYAALD